MAAQRRRTIVAMWSAEVGQPALDGALGHVEVLGNRGDGGYPLVDGKQVDVTDSLSECPHAFAVVVRIGVRSRRCRSQCLKAKSDKRGTSFPHCFR